MWFHNWFRQFMRRNTKPISEDSAIIWKRRLAFAYAFFAWNAFGFVGYMFYKGSDVWIEERNKQQQQMMTPAQQWTKTLGIKDATVYRISGFKAHRYEVHNDFEGGTSSKINIDSGGKITEDKTNIN